MAKTDIIKKTVNKLVWRKRTAEAKKLCAKRKEWAALTSSERNQLRTKETYAYIAYKNLYPDWEKSDKKSYVSDAFYQTKLLPKLNKLNYDVFGMKRTKSYFTDKNYADLFIEDIKFPKTVIKNINGEFYNADFENISENDAKNLLSKYDRLVFKKSIFAGHGKGVLVANKSEYNDITADYKENYIVQEVLEQNALTAKFNESSVNIFRVTSLFWKGEVYILGIIFRVGAPGAFCDHLGQNGVNPRIVGVKPDGTLLNYCLDPDDGVIYKDIFGTSLDVTIPQVPEMIQLVKKTHKKYAHHRLIGWDLALDKNGEIVCIEYNSNVPGVVQTQMLLGPVFGQKTKRGNTLLDEILSE